MSERTPRFTVTDACPPLSEFPYHCHEHGWWSAKKESGCPTCISEARKRIRALELECAVTNPIVELVDELLARAAGQTFDISLAVDASSLRKRIRALPQSEIDGAGEQLAKVTVERNEAKERAEKYERLVERAVNMLWLAIPETREPVHSDSNNPIVAWVADAHAARSKEGK